MSEPDIHPASDDELRTYCQRTAEKTEALIGFVDGRFAAAGGFDYRDNGEVMAWCKVTREVKQHRMAFIKACIDLFAAARVAGHERILAVASPIIPTAPDFLERLGFKEVGERYGMRLFAWEP